MNWQPISTAPKNGTEVLAWIPANTQCMVLAYWQSDGWCDHLTDEEWSPTHWMPLPPPPAPAWQNTTGKDVFVREEDGKWVVD